MTQNKKGFTLVELLIVIAILAILSVAVVLVLNPAELIRRSRDATRISDMAALNSAIALYLTDVSSPGIGGAVGAACGSFTLKCTAATTTAPYVATTTCPIATTSTLNNGTGWVTVDFTQLTGGAPIARLPVDPINTANYPYTYACNGLNFKFGAVMESAKYANATSGYMRAGFDGGTKDGWYEIGNSLTL